MRGDPGPAASDCLAPAAPIDWRRPAPWGARIAIAVQDKERL